MISRCEQLLLAIWSWSLQYAMQIGYFYQTVCSPLACCPGMLRCARHFERFYKTVCSPLACCPGMVRCARHFECFYKNGMLATRMFDPGDWAVRRMLYSLRIIKEHLPLWAYSKHYTWALRDASLFEHFYKTVCSQLASLTVYCEGRDFVCEFYKSVSSHFAGHFSIWQVCTFAHKS